MADEGEFLLLRKVRNVREAFGPADLQRSERCIPKIIPDTASFCEAGDGKMDRITDYIKMMRIKDWIRFYLFFPLTGAFLACGFSPDLIPIGIIFFCVIAYGFVINNYFDVEIDQKHKRKVESDKNPLACNLVTRRGTLLLSIFLVAVPVFLSAMMDALGFLFTFMSIFALTLYSAKPIRLKDWLLVDILCHGIMFGGFPFLAGFALTGGNPAMSPSLLCVATSLCTIVCCEALIAHQINDYEDDLGNTDTTVVRLGKKTGLVLLGVSVLLSVTVLELVVRYTAIEADIHLGILALLISYPLYSCRGYIEGQGRSIYNKNLAPHFQPGR